MVLPGIPDGFPETAHSVHTQRSRSQGAVFFILSRHLLFFWAFYDLYLGRTQPKCGYSN
jgi:hypothetical protein